MTNLIPTPNVSLVDGQPATTSLAIAEHFGKRHDAVVRDIRKLMADLPEEIRAHNFVEAFRTVPGPNNSQRQEVFFTVFFDGFILLVMGYTGKRALQIKLVYIAAFNSMRDQLTEQPTPALDTTSRLSRRTDPERKALTAIINTWVSMAPVHYASARVQVNSHFGVAKVDDLTVEQVKEAIMWVQAKIDELPKSLPEPAAPVPLDDSRERMIRAKAEEMRKLMWKAGNVMRELRGIVIAEHARVRPNDFDTMLITNDLHEANEKAFRAFESLADTIAYNVMAIRKMVKARV